MRCECACLFATATWDPSRLFFLLRMVLARVQDWASSAAVPFDGRPQGGGHLESTARVRAEGALDLSIRWAPVPSLEPITLRSNRPSAAAVRLDRSWTLMFRCHDNARALSARYISRSEPQVWTSERRVGALSGTLSCFAVTHPVPPVCDRCLQTGGSIFGSRQGARCSSVSLYLPYCDFQKTYGSCTRARLSVFCRSPL